MSRSYPHSFNTVLDCYHAKQCFDKQNSLDAFLARQQRIKARHSEAQTASNIHATATTLNADVSEFEGVNRD